MSLDDLLGQVYHVDQVEHDQAKASKLIKDAIAADPEIEGKLKTRFIELQQVRAARRMGAKDGCHVTGVLCDVLARVIA